jgi:hypothetical protein
MKWTYFAIALVAVLYLLESNNVIDVDGNRTGESTSAIVQAIEQGSSQKPVNNIHEKWKADTAMYFYQSLSLYNYPHAAKYVTEPKIILAMKEGHGRLTVKENSYRVKEVNEEGVVMLFSRFCYPDLESMVYMDHTAAGFRIDFRRTLKEQIRNVPSNHVPVRQYCYDFKDQSLQGNIMGGDWQPTRVEKNTVNFPSGPENRIAFVNERCELYPDCTFINDNNKSGYILYVTHLDLTGTGGNLGGTEYVHLFRYPNYNQSFYEGSYRVIQLGSGKIRLELSIPEFESIEFNGYVEFEI